MINTAFEPLIAACDVEDAILEVLELWLPDYLWELERQRGGTPGLIALPRAYTVSSATERMPEDQLPAVVVVSPGTTDPPEAAGDGVYVARWDVRLAAQVAARGGRDALRLARLYACAMRAAILQQQTLGTLPLRRIDWLGERYDELDSVDDRTVCVGETQLAVEVAGVLTRGAGPLQPGIPPMTVPAPDSPTWPQIDRTDVQIIQRSLED